MAWRPARQHHLPSRLWHALRRPRQRPSTVLHRRVAPVVVLRSVVVSTLWGARTPVGCPVCRLCSNAHRAVDCLWLVRRLSALPPWRSPAPHQPLTSPSPAPHQSLTSRSPAPHRSSPPFEPTRGQLHLHERVPPADGGRALHLLPGRRAAIQLPGQLTRIGWDPMRPQ